MVVTLTFMVLSLILTLRASAQPSGTLVWTAESPPRFEDFPVKGVLRHKPVTPILTGEVAGFEPFIRQGVSKGWGVFNGATGKELHGPGQFSQATES